MFPGRLVYSVLFALTISGCGETKEPTPTEIAESNHYSEYRLSNGTSILLSNSYCETEVIMSGSGKEYRKCRARLQGYVHDEIRYCPTEPKASCELTIPKVES